MRGGDLLLFVAAAHHLLYLQYSSVFVVLKPKTSLWSKEETPFKDIALG